MGKIKPTTLQNNYNKAINAYIKIFEEVHDILFEGWVGNDIGTVALFADYYIDFSDIKYSIDNNVRFDILIEWYDFTLRHHPKHQINLNAYFKLRRDEERKGNFDLKKFEKYLIDLRK